MRTNQRCDSFSVKMQLTSDEANWMKVNTWRGDNEDKVARPRPSLISLESKRPPGTFAHRTSFTKSQAGQEGPAGGAEGSFYSHSSFSCHRHQGRFLEPDEIYFRQCFNILWQKIVIGYIAHCLMSFTPVRHAKWNFWNCSVCFLWLDSPFKLYVSNLYLLHFILLTLTFVLCALYALYLALHVLCFSIPSQCFMRRGRRGAYCYRGLEHQS